MVFWRTWWELPTLACLFTEVTFTYPQARHSGEPTLSNNICSVVCNEGRGNQVVRPWPDDIPPCVMPAALCGLSLYCLEVMSLTVSAGLLPLSCLHHPVLGLQTKQLCMTVYTGISDLSLGLCFLWSRNCFCWSVSLLLCAYNDLFIPNRNCILSICSAFPPFTRPLYLPYKSSWTSCPVYCPLWSKASCPLCLVCSVVMMI